MKRQKFLRRLRRLIKKYGHAMLIDVLRESKLGASKHIIYWVTDIQEFGRLNISDVKNDQSNEGIK